MRLTIVGCAGTIPGPASAASCYLVEHDGFRLVVDLGNGALGALQRHISIDQIDALAISHLHADHFIDLTALYVARRYGPSVRAGRIPVHGPSDTADRLAASSDLPRLSGLRASFDFSDLALTTEIGPFQVRTARMAHPVTTFGIRLQAGGASLVYSGDTGPCDQLVELADGADMLLAEASFVDGEVNPTDLHLTGREAGETATKAEVGHLVLTHVPPWHRPEIALQEATEAFTGITALAASGMVFEVGG